MGDSDAESPVPHRTPQKKKGGRGRGLQHSGVGRPALTDAQEREVREAFSLFGMDKSAEYIGIPDLLVALRALGQEPTKEEIVALHDEYDKDGSGKPCIGVNEFVKIMANKMVEPDSDELLDTAFKFFDDENKGYITIRELKRIAAELGEALTDEELSVMLNEADSNQTRRIGKDEFTRIMRLRRR